MPTFLRQNLPVIISICLILLIAYLRNYSKTLAAITATMPINIPLSMWIIYSADQNDSKALVDYTQALMINLVPTILFVIVAWLALRAGWSLIPSLVAGYVMWAVTLGITVAIRAALGF
jgi:hypothetical protein